MSLDQYENPLISRYASPEMSRVWSPRQKFRTWRRLWVALAEAEAELGLDIQPRQIAELKAHIDDIDFAKAREYEQRLRHDVMAHVHTYADVCPAARAIIHLGATSCYVTDNTDILLLRESLELVLDRLVRVIDHLGSFAAETRDLACLGLTHLQPAQPTTVGKRACLWAYDLILDLEELQHRLAALKLRGVKGTTGTQASFLRLFGGDHQKVRELERRVAEKMGLPRTYAVTGQTYPRKVDAQILAALSGIASSAHKASTDLRLLQSRGEIEEPIEADQIGSSAMPYKRNPMRAERIGGLARFVMSLESSGTQTAATQWMERTLDDSANRRLVLPQAMLAVDAVLMLYANIAGGLDVYPRVIARHLSEELPQMATENILMTAVAAGGDRQALHERIRRHSREAAARMKNEGLPNDLIDRLRADAAFEAVDFDTLLDASQYIGRAPRQVDQFIDEEIEPIRAKCLNRARQHETNVRV